MRQPIEHILSEQDAMRRFERARASGRPEWLWPDVTLAECREAVEGFATIAAGILDGHSPAEPLCGDARVVGVAGYLSGMGPLLGYWIEQGQLRARSSTADLLLHHLAHNRRRNAALIEHANAIVGELRDAGIAAVLLKGMHTAHAYFPDPGTRPMSDIDILVGRSNADAAHRIMETRGYALVHRDQGEATWRHLSSRRLPRTFSHVHADDPWTIDLHQTLNLRPASAAPPLDLDSLSLASRPFEAAGRTFSGLSEQLLLLHLACHTGYSFQNLTLLRLVELALVLRRESALDWHALLEMAEQSRVAGGIYPALRLCEQLCPSTVPRHVLERCESAAPGKVRRALASLTPATAQQIGFSLRRHFMWSDGAIGLARQAMRDVLAPTKSLQKSLALCRTVRARLLGG